jgi:hypothetical protein
MFIPLTLLGGTIPSWQLCGNLRLLGGFSWQDRFLRYWSLSAGDVSLATPVLSLKILLVALLSTFLIRESVGRKPLDSGISQQCCDCVAQLQRHTGASSCWKDDTSSPHSLPLSLRLCGCPGTTLVARVGEQGAFLPLMMGFRRRIFNRTSTARKIHLSASLKQRRDR